MKNDLASIENKLKRFSVDFTFIGQEVYIKQLNVRLHSKKHAFVFDSIDYLISLQQKLMTTVSVVRGQIVVHVKGVKFNIKTQSDLAVIHDIFVSEEYNFIPSRPAVVIDIGMNVGIASLFFSRHENVKKIYGFEPFKPTYSQALKNLKLNTNFGHKVTAINRGWGRKSETLISKYDPMNQAMMSVSYDAPAILGTLKPRKEKVELLDAGTGFSNILKKHPKAFIIMKMDCQGSEYGIIERLHETKQLNRVNFLILEWHRRGPGEIIRGPGEIIAYLKKNDMNVFSVGTDNPETGMIYAFGA
jgi:FkbM family methyltransferase